MAMKNNGDCVKLLFSCANKVEGCNSSLTSCHNLVLLNVWLALLVGSEKKSHWHPNEVQNPFSGQNEADLCSEVCW
jgi:hypothetical protein